MRTRRSKIERLEDMFADLTLAEQASLLQVFNGLRRQKARNGAPLAEKAPRTAPPVGQSMFDGGSDAA